MIQNRFLYRYQSVKFKTCEATSREILAKATNFTVVKVLSIQRNINIE